MSKTNVGTRTKKHFEQFLSAAQRGVWGAQKINPASPMFNRFASLTDLLEGERKYRESEQFHRDRQYWRERLAGAAEPVGLGSIPSESARTPIRRTARLSPSVTARLRAMGKESGTTLTQIIAAAMGVYLFRLTGATDVRLDLAVTGRVGPLARRAPAMMSDVLPLRLALSQRRSSLRSWNRYPSKRVAR